MTLRFRLRTLLIAMLVVGVAAGLLGRAWRAYQAEEIANVHLRLLMGKLLAASWPANSRLSWRVHILRELGESALADEFHLYEPWDSPHNLRLLPRMPAVFRMPYSQAPPGFTCVHAGDVSSLVFIVESEDDQAVPWTRPGLVEGEFKDDNAVRPYELTLDGVPLRVHRAFGRGGG